MTDTTPPKEHLGVGLLVSRTFELFFRHILTFVVISLVPTALLIAPAYFLVPEAILVGAGGVADPADLFTPGYFVYTFVSFLAVFIVMGVITMAAYDIQSGRPLRTGYYVSRTLASVLPLLVLGVLFYIMLVIGLVLLILPGLYIAARFGIFVPAVLIEGVGFAGLRRSSELTDGYRWSLIGAYIVFFIVVFVLSFGLQFVSELILSVGVGGLFMVTVLQIITASITYALSGLFGALVYARLRQVKEGLGFDDLADVFS